MHLNAFRVGQCIAQLEERDVGILCDQFFKESLMRRKLAVAARRALRGRLSMTSGLHLARPSCTCCWRQLQTQRRRTPA